MDVAFIGLGRMGNHMARHLAEKGNQVAVYDTRPQAVSSLSEIPGIRGARSLAEATQGAEIVGTSLPGPREVEAVALGPGGLIEHMRPGSVYVDLSTNSPSTVRKVAAALKARGIEMLDAPVSGGTTGAEAGTLSIMVGGDEATFERVRPFLEAIGNKLFYCGPSGNGDVVKLCNNIVGQAYASALAEVLTLGVKAGVDLRTLVLGIGNSTGTHRRLTGGFPRRTFRRNWDDAQFSAALSAKDTRLAVELAREHGVPMAIGDAVDRDMQYVMDQGWGEQDFEIIVRAQEDRVGLKLELTPEEIEDLKFG